MYRLIIWYYRIFNWRLRMPVNLGDRSEIATWEWNQLVGDTGEDLSCIWLWTHGRKVLYRQYVAKGGGEVDIIFREGDILVFCEVKTRTSKDFGNPAQAVNRKKQRLITRGANAWIRELGFVPLLFRFDIIEVILIEGQCPEINHIENAFNAAPMLLA